MTTVRLTEEAAGTAIAPSRAVLPEAWDPFQLMDRLDEEALKRELEGIASTDLVYVVKAGGQEVVGLSKVGVDECCMVLVSQGQVIREEDLVYEVMGEGEDREALFKVRAARYAVSAAGQEVKLDQVIGVKRQPLFHEPQVLDLDTKAPSKKYRGKTYRDLLSFDEGREYLGWMAENFTEPEIRAFVVAILSGEEILGQRGRQLNPHWYEAGAMKAARNARFRLIPADTKALIIARARQNGQAQTVDRSRPAAGPAQPSAPTPRAAAAAPAPAPESGAAPAARTTSTRGTEQPTGSYAPTEKQIAFYQRLAESPVFTEEERRRALEWLATRATRQTIKDQIDWLKRQVETRRAPAAAVRRSDTDNDPNPVGAL
jgi:hypothetical protein